MSKKWSDIEHAFYRAAIYVALKAHELDLADICYLYGRFKQAQEGPCKEAVPYLFSFIKQSKWEAWHSLGEMSQEEAMEQYVNKLNTIAPDWNAKAHCLKENAEEKTASTSHTEAKKDEYCSSSDASLSENETKMKLNLPGTEVNLNKLPLPHDLHDDCVFVKQVQHIELE